MFKNVSIIGARMILFEQGGTLARVLSLCLNRMPVFVQESLVGYPLLLWQYTSTALTPTHCKFSHGHMPGVFFKRFSMLSHLACSP